MDIVIVTHGDGVGAVVGMLREGWAVSKVDYTAFAVASRKVKVLKKGSEDIINEEYVYKNPDEWDLKLGKGLVAKPIKNKAEQAKAHKIHEEEMREMNAAGKTIKTDYVLDDEQVERYKVALKALGAHNDDTEHMLLKTASSNHMNEKGNR